MEEEKKPMLFGLPYMKDLWEDQDQLRKEIALFKDTVLRGLKEGLQGQDAFDAAKAKHATLPFHFPHVVYETQDAWVQRCQPIFRNFMLLRAVYHLNKWMRSVPALQETIKKIEELDNK